MKTNEKYFIFVILFVGFVFSFPRQSRAEQEKVGGWVLEMDLK